MADSFEYVAAAKASHKPVPRKVLVTGAAGNIGSYFANHAPEHLDLRLLVHPDDDTADIDGRGQIIKADITDIDQVYPACRGIDTVLHLAGNPSPSATWQSLRSVNIDGTYNVMVAAKAADCRRVIFASSIHAVSGYPADRQVQADDPVNPGDLYGVTKCFGEAMGRYMAVQENLSVIAVRICAFQPKSRAEDEKALRLLDSFVSRRDLHQLFERCIDDTSLKFAIVHGISNNRFKTLDVSEARELLGYAPQDDLTELNPKLEDLHLRDVVMAHDESHSGMDPGIRQELSRLRTANP